MPRASALRRGRGSALAVLLLILALVLVFLAGVVALGAHHARLVHGNLLSVAAVQAAEAGLHNGIHRVAGNHAWNSGFTDVHLGGELDPRFSVQVVNNLSGLTPVNGPHGLTCPPGYVLLVSTGTCGDVSRSAAVFLSSGLRFAYAIAAGGGLQISAAGTIRGSLKSVQDLTISSRVEVAPVEGEGRVLCGEDLIVSGGLVMEAGQACLARGTIDGISKIRNASPITPNDTSPDTDPFVMDGRITNDPAEGEEIMPNPDRSVLLASSVPHPGFQDITGTEFDLDGQVHYFPDGVRFGSGSRIVGQGVIVVDNANSAVFDIPLDNHMDIIVLDGHDGTVGGGAIRFNRSARLQGLVYCQGSVYSSPDFRLEGRIITYGDGMFVHTGAHVEVALNPAMVLSPGFDAFFGPGSGPLGLGISSWQRL